MARSDLVAVLRLPAAPGVPEAWLTLVTGDERTGGRERATSGIGPDPPGAERPGLGPGSDRPHVVRLANGQVLQVESFWIEDGELRFKRLGGIVGIALAEIAGLLPHDPGSARGRTAARFARQTGPHTLEVWVRGVLQKVRLIGIEPVPGAHAATDPWDRLDRGIVLYLEFDRQRYDPAGEWLAYVHLPNGRMLNTELIRVGLARPRLDAGNVRYIDLFHEVAQETRTRTPDPH
jgi:endonuclease YncB( thermonuclease family)